MVLRTCDLNHVSQTSKNNGLMDAVHLKLLFPIALTFLTNQHFLIMSEKVVENMSMHVVKKKNGRTFRREDSQHPHESVALNGLGTYPVINGTPIIMPPPPPLEDCLPVEDLPPSYEEAIKQCAPAIPVPISEPNKIVSHRLVIFLCKVTTNSYTPWKPVVETWGKKCFYLRWAPT
ncbi:uncharacterized protein LOC111635061 [Centruroides sculpturatus]|uniref:uncharacterized protein LOC111635061 n=1 Tax=Centruroides sculpturatus TaxID=218467 RepID=UPI000C6C968D|nr:uncharacterized protein LOC111635061 [Centruroides sculpturatus]